MNKRRIKPGPNEDRIWIRSDCFWIIRHGQACCMMQSGVVTFSWVHTAVQHTDYGRKVFRFQLLIPARAHFDSWKKKRYAKMILVDCSNDSTNAKFPP